MTAYQRDDGAEMVEYRPGRTIRRDVGIRLGLIAPDMMLGRSRGAALAPSADTRSEPVAPPPLQPSHEDLVAAVSEPADAVRCSRDDEGLARRAADLVSADVTDPGSTIATITVPARAPKTRPAKRPLSVILAESDRNHRARRWS